MRRNLRQADVKIEIEILDEEPQRYRGIIRPIACQEMIEINIRQDTSETAKGRREASHARLPSRVCVGEGINLTVTADALLIRLRKRNQLRRRCKIWQEISHSKPRG